MLRKAPCPEPVCKPGQIEESNLIKPSGTFEKKGQVAVRNISIERLHVTPLCEQAIEIVERKGIGHPDSICDGIMEHVSQVLAAEYRRRFGFIPHYNLDKGMLVAGAAEHKPGGGCILVPMRLILGDRATFDVGGEQVPVKEIAIKAAKEWFRANLPPIDPERDVIYQVELLPGAPELASIFQRTSGPLKANDTSAAVGYAPLTETERLVFEAEHFLNSAAFKREFPESGYDVKVMGFRVGQSLDVTVAMPLIDRYVTSEEFYLKRKKQIVEALQTHLDSLHDERTHVQISLNTLDAPGKGIEGMYLSVVGTSAEDGDSGEVGRGNRVNGVISLRRPASAEAAAGKNPVSHVGKIYNVLSHKLAQRIYGEVPGLREVYIWLGSQIGLPIDQPRIAAAQLILEPGVRLPPTAKRVERLIDDELANIAAFTEELVEGKYRIY